MASPSVRYDLLQAVRCGSLDIVYDLVEAGASVNSSDGLQGTLLCAAIHANQPEVALYLIEADCDVNAPDIDGEPPISLAIRKGHIDMVEMVLRSSRCDIHHVDPVSLNQPLGVAITHGTAAMVKILVDAGCDVSKQGKDYNTAWHLAVMHHRHDVIDVLMSAKSGDVNMWNKSGKTALHIAVEHSDAIMLRCLLEKCTILFKPPFSEYEVTHMESPCHLDLDRQTMFDGNTPLHLAIMHKNFQITELLINAGCNIHISNEMMHTPLFFACKESCIATVTLLLRNGADPNITRQCHEQFHVRRHVAAQSPLHLVVRCGSLAVVRILVEAGADLNPIWVHHPLVQALMADKPEIVEYLLTEGIQRGLDMSRIDGSNGQNVLGVVECCRNVRWFMQRLIDLGCLVNGSHNNRLPLEYAVDCDCTEAVEVLMDNGADANAPLSGQTALQHCIMDDMSEGLLHLLLFYGADINVRTVEGDSLIRLALDNFNTLFVKYLVAVGYNLSQEEKVRDYATTAENNDSECCHIANDIAASDDISCDVSSTSSDSEAELYAWLARRAAHPCTLHTQCRTALRAYFVNNSIHMKRMVELPLPRKMKDFIMLRTLYEETMSI